MALTPEQIDRLIQQADGLAPKEGSIFRALAKLTEAEVRKQDDALILQMVDALEGSIAITMGKIDLRNAAIAAAREELAERLGVKEGQANAIARELLCTHQAEEWGSRLTSKGTLAPVLQAKEASNVA